MFQLIWTCIIGIVIGGVAKFLLPGKDPGGIWVTMIIGIAGSILANFLGKTMGWYKSGETAGFIMAVIGSILLLLAYRMFSK